MGLLNPGRRVVTWIRWRTKTTTRRGNYKVVKESIGSASASWLKTRFILTGSSLWLRVTYSLDAIYCINLIQSLQIPLLLLFAARWSATQLIQGTASSTTERNFEFIGRSLRCLYLRHEFWCLGKDQQCPIYSTHFEACFCAKAPRRQGWIYRKPSTSTIHSPARFPSAYK